SSMPCAISSKVKVEGLSAAGAARLASAPPKTPSAAPPATLFSAARRLSRASMISLSGQLSVGLAARSSRSRISSGWRSERLMAGSLGCFGNDEAAIDRGADDHGGSLAGLHGKVVTSL